MGKRKASSNVDSKGAQRLAERVERDVPDQR